MRKTGYIAPALLLCLVNAAGRLEAASAVGDQGEIMQERQGYGNTEADSSPVSNQPGMVGARAARPGQPRATPGSEAAQGWVYPAQPGSPVEASRSSSGHVQMPAEGQVPDVGTRERRLSQDAGSGGREAEGQAYPAEPQGAAGPQQAGQGQMQPGAGVANYPMPDGSVRQQLPEGQDANHVPGQRIEPQNRADAPRAVDSGRLDPNANPAADSGMQENLAPADAPAKQVPPGLGKKKKKKKKPAALGSDSAVVGPAQPAPAQPAAAPLTMPTPQPSPEVRPEVEEAAPRSTAASYHDPEKASYEAATVQKIEALAAELRELKKQLQKTKGRQEKKVQEALRTANGNRSVARTKLKQLSNASADKWRDLKPGVDSATEELRKSLDRTRSYLPTSH